MIHTNENIFNDKDVLEGFLNKVESCVANTELKDGELQADKTYDTTIRRNKVAWITDKEIRYAISDYVMGVNVGTLGIDLYPFQAEVQYAEYRAEDAGFHEWHADHDMFDDNIKGVSCRKYSATMQLDTMGKDYEGGKFEIQNLTLPEQFYTRGSFILFPSPIIHRVAPVTKGIRRSLVFFFHGPRWK
tara:strand:+ start:92 stop:655 length:564 start_codon:yes stop_codon:yes gene_type:complete